MKRRQFLGGSLAAVAIPAAVPARQVRAAELPADITDMSATLLSAAIRQRFVSCREVMTAYLERIHRYNPVYNAIVSMKPDEECLAEAAAADEALDRGDYRGWMHGMPHAPKDDGDVVGFPTSHGSPIFAGQMPEKDSLHIQRIRAQGPIFIGKTNLPEFGMGSQSYNRVFGATGSAWNPDLTAGGSSGGTACGLGTRMLPVGDGGDFMGSLRNPGAFNGVIGFRPTQARIPWEGDYGDLFYQQMGTTGPMGRTTEDTVRMFVTMAGSYPLDPLSLRDPLPSADDFQPTPLNRLRVGWLGDYEGHLPMEAGVLELCEASLAMLADAGVIVERCRPDYDLDRLWQTWLTLRHWSRNSEGLRELYEDPATRTQLKPEAIWEYEGCLNTSARDIYDAGVARADWYRVMHELFNDYHVLVVPTAQVFPFDKTVHWPRTVAGRDMDTYHRWMEVVIGASLAGIPSVNVPVGTDEADRPMGMQVMGPFGEDRRVLEFALAYELVTGHLERQPRLVEPRERSRDSHT